MNERPHYPAFQRIPKINLFDMNNQQLAIAPPLVRSNT